LKIIPENINLIIFSAYKMNNDRRGLRKSERIKNVHKRRKSFSNFNISTCNLTSNIKKPKKKTKAEFNKGNEERLARALDQQLYLVEIIPSEESEKEKSFAVMGTTGNVYTVNINETPKCNCFDHRTSKQRCKHIYFVLVKVLKNEEYCHKASYNDEELSFMLENIPQELSEQLIVNENLKSKYLKKIGRDENKVFSSTQSKDDNCPICLEELQNGAQLDFCQLGCGKYIHSICFTMWAKKNNSICVFCRQVWKNNTKKDARKLINLLNK